MESNLYTMSGVVVKARVEIVVAVTESVGNVVEIKRKTTVGIEL
jgi:hypothetical protein